MSVIGARPREGSLRRTRSAGDVSRLTDRIQRPSNHEGRSDSYDQPLLTSSSQPSPPTLPSMPTTGPSSRVWPPSPAITAHTGDSWQTQTVDPPAVLRREVHLSPQRQPGRSLCRRTLTFLGQGREASPTRRSLVSLIFNLLSGFAQIVITVTLLGLSGTHFKSPTQPDLTEWVACDRPLGIWACIWVVRVVLACGLTYWGFLRDRKGRQHHAEAGSSAGSSIGANASITRPTNPLVNAPSPQSTSPFQTANRVERPPLPHTQLYSRLTLLSSLLTLSWFLTAHILEYTSINTCRQSSPHIWWLIFGILCIMYLMVLEVILLGLLVFVVAPILFLFWNIFLVCIGRHPIQTAGVIKPEIGKLSKSLVDRIPLVMYIPPPPDGEKLAVPEQAYSYPPNPPLTTLAPLKPRFKFIRIPRFGGKKSEGDTSTQPLDEKDAEKYKQPLTWEEHWEQGEHPFVVLEGNRAACAICLMDFEEPKRMGGSASADPVKEEGVPKSAQGPYGIDAPDDSLPTVRDVPDEIVEVRQIRESLKLADAGFGAQPLRLLACGHAFHQTCLDPWLTDVSGRCPVCQRAVEIPELPKKSRKEQHQSLGV